MRTFVKYAMVACIALFSFGAAEARHAPAPSKHAPAPSKHAAVKHRPKHPKKADSIKVVIICPPGVSPSSGKCFHVQPVLKKFKGKTVVHLTPSSARKLFKSQ